MGTSYQFSWMIDLMNGQLKSNTLPLATVQKRMRRSLVVAVAVAVAAVVVALSSAAQHGAFQQYALGPFNSSHYSTLTVLPPATISNDALQLTPDSIGNFDLTHRSGRVLLNRPFKLWEWQPHDESKLASFTTSFLLNIFRLNDSVPAAEGLAFLVSPDLLLPHASDGQFLGLTNSSTDGLSRNHILAVELDTSKQDFDPDANHIGLNLNSIRSTKTVPLSPLGIQLAPTAPVFHVVWVHYDGLNKLLHVYIAEQKSLSSPTPSKPSTPFLSAIVDLRDVVSQYSYFGFSASTGSNVQLNCVLRWNLSVELLPGTKAGHNHDWLSIKVAIGVSLILALLIGTGGVAAYFLYRKQRKGSDPEILCALNSLPGTPREFRFRDLRKATNNFDDENKLGQGGFGVVYRGLLPNENLEIAVKKFCRDDMDGKDDFLAELTIINRLRHKHLVRLLGWCHKNGMLLLVYDYMSNGSLDNHLFRGPKEKKTELGWPLRYRIISGVASALHYLHNEYDQKVVHRDLKASNIMLDADFSARLGDFGMARALEHEKTSYVESEGVPGTMGYIAPECFHTGKATRESDVYAFGAVSLEVVCGQRPWSKIGGFQSLVDWVWWLYREGKLVEAVDERLHGECVKEEAERLLVLGLACSHPIGSERPKTEAIIQIVAGSIPVPPVPHFKPAFVWPSVVGLGSLNTTNSNIIAGTAETTPATSGWTPRLIGPHGFQGDGGKSDCSSLT